MKAPFRYFGGKSRAAETVWRAFGNPKHYCEPFAGSAAILLARPDEPRRETANDLNGYICNFWRSVKSAPDAVAEHLRRPINATEYQSIAKHLHEQQDALRESLVNDLRFFDAEIAALWVYGSDLTMRNNFGSKSTAAQPAFACVNGVHADGFKANAVQRLREISARLSKTDWFCGDWEHAIRSEGMLTRGQSDIAIFFDPPYRKRADAYECKDMVHERLQKFCVEHQDKIKMAICGHEGEFDLPGWRAHQWLGNIGYLKSGNDRKVEHIWFSPMCNDVDGQLTL